MKRKCIKCTGLEKGSKLIPANSKECFAEISFDIHILNAYFLHEQDNVKCSKCNSTWVTDAEAEAIFKELGGIKRSRMQFLINQIDLP